jgi:glyoxylase-like metal-dependent hydrolase (beta-lactamase superfamily II)/rhodanese-related sulfurtransferase
MSLMFRQLFDPTSSTYTYLLGCARTRKSVLIDPVFEQARRDAALIEELGLTLLYTLDTHVHADHVTGAWLLKQRMGSQIALGAATKAINADRLLSPGEHIQFGDYYVEARATPGHTNDSLTYVLGDESMAFTGDALLIRGCGRTDFQQGSGHALYNSIWTQIFTLPDTCLLYPGHDYRGLTVTSVAEEKRFNPRLREGISERDFVGYMDNLNLPHPKQMDIAVPANLKCGKPDNESTPKGADWAPLHLTFAGISEIVPSWVEEHSGEAVILDVREPDEFTGPLGHIAGAKLLPLNELAKRTVELSKDRPIVTVCRSGARSAQATVLLRQAGFSKVANLAGGMLRWHAEGYPAEGGKT